MIKKSFVIILSFIIVLFNSDMVVAKKVVKKRASSKKMTNKRTAKNVKSSASFVVQPVDDVKGVVEELPSLEVKKEEVATLPDVQNVVPVQNFVDTVETEKLAENNRAKNNALNELQAKISDTQSSCSGIKSSLDTIFGLSVATTVSSGLGTVAAGGALAVGIVKAKTDKKFEENSHLLEAYKKAIASGNPEDLDKFDEEMEKISKIIESGEQNKLEKKSKTLGNVRTGLMAGATVTSAVSTGTSIGATVNAEKLAKKMSDCNEAVRQLKLAISIAEAEEVEEEKLALAREITSACTGFDKDNINTLKTQMTASAIVSGIGTATAGAGTITSAMANSKKVREDDSEKGRKKEKGLNLASNILAGVTMGTSATSTVLSATAIADAKKDSKMAEECEAVLK